MITIVFIDCYATNFPLQQLIVVRASVVRTAERLALKYTKYMHLLIHNN